MIRSPDGMHFERSPSYHLQVFYDLLECYALLPPSGIRDRLGERLDAMAAVCADMTHPDERPSLFADGGLHMAVPPGNALALCQQLRGSTAVPRRLWYRRDAGYAGARWGEDLVLVDCGRIGPDHLPAHAHGDVFAFEWSIAGRRLIVDAGVFEYHPGPWRRLSRSTGAHNTLTLDDRDQAEFYSSFRVGRRPNVTVEAWEPDDAGGAFVLRGVHDGYRHLSGRAMHRRTFRVTRDRIHVSDEVAGGAGQCAVARLLVPPDIRVVATVDGALLTHGSLAVRLQTTAAVAVRPAVWMPDFGVQHETSQLEMTYGSAPCAGEFRLIVETRPA